MLSDPIMQAGLRLPGLKGLLWPVGALGGGSAEGSDAAASAAASPAAGGEAPPVAVRSNSTGARFATDTSPGGWPQAMYEEGSEIVDGLDVLLGVLGDKGPSVKDAHKMLTASSVPALGSSGSASSLLPGDEGSADASAGGADGSGTDGVAPSSIAAASSSAASGAGTGAPGAESMETMVVPLHRRVANHEGSADDWSKQADEAVKGSEAQQLHVEADFSPAGTHAAKASIARHVPVLDGDQPLLGD